MNFNLILLSSVQFRYVLHFTCNEEQSLVFSIPFVPFIPYNRISIRSYLKPNHVNMLNQCTISQELSINERVTFAFDCSNIIQRLILLKDISTYVYIYTYILQYIYYIYICTFERLTLVAVWCKVHYHLIFKHYLPFWIAAIFFVISRTNSLLHFSPSKETFLYA